MFESLVIGWFLTFGYIPSQTECVNQAMVSITSNEIATVAEIGLSAEYAPFKLYGSIENYQFFSGKPSFYPFRADYKAGFEFKITEGITFVAEHECDHPVVSCTNGKAQFNYVSQVTKVLVRIEGGGK